MRAPSRRSRSPRCPQRFRPRPPRRLSSGATPRSRSRSAPRVMTEAVRSRVTRHVHVVRRWRTGCDHRRGVAAHGSQPDERQDLHVHGSREQRERCGRGVGGLGHRGARNGSGRARRADRREGQRPARGHHRRPGRQRESDHGLQRDLHVVGWRRAGNDRRPRVADNGDRSHQHEDVHVHRVRDERHRSRTGVGAFGGDRRRPSRHVGPADGRGGEQSGGCHLPPAGEQRREPDHQLQRDLHFVRRRHARNDRGPGVADRGDRSHEREDLHVHRDRDERRGSEPALAPFGDRDAGGRSRRTRRADRGRRARPRSSSRSRRPLANGSPITSYTASCTSSNGGVPGAHTRATGPITVTPPHQRQDVHVHGRRPQHRRPEPAFAALRERGAGNAARAADDQGRGERQRGVDRLLLSRG